MKRFLTVIALSSAVALAADAGAATVSGYISDSNCGAKHSASAPDPDCVKKCIDGGAKPVFVDDAKNQVWTIDDPSVVKSSYGEHVKVVGKVDDASKSIHISKVTKLSN
jgi:hypothetical protein